MVGGNAGTTNPALLNRLVDWRDHEAWVDFVRRYDPVIRSSCRRYRLDATSTDEVCQHVWIELARCMRTFRYDPGRTFRGWLRRLCRSRSIDLLRKQMKAGALEPLDDQLAGSLREDVPADIEDDEHAGRGRSVLLRQAEEVQEAVRKRVSERTWQAFWSIAIEGRSVRETATSTGLSYYAAFAAGKRVGQMLRREGERFLTEQGLREQEVGWSGD